MCTPRLYRYRVKTLPWWRRCARLSWKSVGRSVPTSSSCRATSMRTTCTQGLRFGTRQGGVWMPSSTTSGQAGWYILQLYLTTPGMLGLPFYALSAAAVPHTPPCCRFHIRILHPVMMRAIVYDGQDHQTPDTLIAPTVAYGWIDEASSLSHTHTHLNTYQSVYIYFTE